MKVNIDRRMFLTAIPAFALSACSSSGQSNEAQSTDQASVDVGTLQTADVDVESTSLGDSELHQYAQDNLFASLESSLPSEDYKLVDVQTTYISKEYLEELEYNSKENVYFGLTLSELGKQFQGTKYSFTVKDGKTVAHAVEEFDNTFNEVMTNVAIGAGVILVCATISVAAGAISVAAVGTAAVAAGADAVSVVFAASAETGALLATGLTVLGGVGSGIAEGLATGDIDKALKSAAVGASEGFKWGAISGAVIGGISSVVGLNTTVPTWKASEEYVQKIYGGEAQKAFLNGEEVVKTTSGSTRPDIIRWIEDKIEAIEVKNYNLASKSSYAELKSVLKQEITARKLHLPEGSTQRVVLDIRGRGFSNELVSAVVDDLTNMLKQIDPTVIVETLG